MKQRIIAVLTLFVLVAAPVAMADTAAHLQSVMDQANISLAASGSDIRVAYAEWITATGETDEVGSTVFFQDVGNKQLAFDFVPFDPRRTSTPAGLLLPVVWKAQMWTTTRPRITKGSR